VTGTAEKLGKHPGKDQEQDKMTWVALRGTDGTRQDACREIESAVKALKNLPWDTGFFAAFAESLLDRVQ
jgi:geranylgeranyl diphosphate synthase type II